MESKYSRIRIMLDDTEPTGGTRWHIQQTLIESRLHQYLDKNDAENEFGHVYKFFYDELCFQILHNGNNLRQYFWDKEMPHLAHNFVASVVLIQSNLPETFFHARWITLRDYRYNSATDRWNYCYSPPLIAVANLDYPEAWDFDDIKLYFRDIPVMGYVPIDVYNLQSIKNVLIMALDGALDYLPD